MKIRMIESRNDKMDAIQKGVLGYEAGDNRSDYNNIVGCEKVGDDKYDLTFKDGKHYEATVYTLDDVCDFIVSDNESGKKLLYKFVKETYSESEFREAVSEFYDGRKVSFKDAMNDAEFREYIFEDFYAQADFVDIMNEFVENFGHIWKGRGSADQFVFENGDFWFCLV